MSWGRLDDQANGNSKLLALSDAAWRMWGCGLIYCQANLTDGFIPDHAIHTFGVRAKNKAAVADELCRSLVPGKAPLWERADGGFRVHDYFDWNDSKAEILREREKSNDRLRRWRDHKRNGVSSTVSSGVANAAQNSSETRSVQVSTTTTTRVPPKTGEPRPRPRGAWNRGLSDSPLHHGECLAHGPICLKPQVVDGMNLLALFNGNQATLTAWAEKVCERWSVRVESGAQIYTADAFEFWRTEYKRDFASQQPKAVPQADVAGPRVLSVDATAAYLAEHRRAGEK